MRSFMKRRKRYVSFLGLLLLPWVFAVGLQEPRNAYGADSKTIELGKKVYESRCLICHGPQGDGQGRIGIIDRAGKSGMVWVIYPRDFTDGVFKFRSTPTGCLPGDKDLLGIVTDGILRSGMPSHKDIPSKERSAVIEYMKAFSQRWKEEEPCKFITAKKPAWVGSPASVQKGERMYDEMKCWECHGKQGKGDGPKSGDLQDDWGKPIMPFDFTTGLLKRGTSPENIYITFTTGLDGSGMPSYEDSMKDEERWHLVSYTLKLMGKAK